MNTYSPSSNVPQRTQGTHPAAYDKEVTQKATNEIQTYASAVIETMKTVADLADKGVANVLFAGGFVLILLAIGLRIAPLLHPLSSLDFVVTVVVGMLMVGFSTGLRFYDFKTHIQASREIREHGWKLAEQAFEATKEDPEPRPKL